MIAVTTNTAYLVGMSAKTLTVNVTHDPKGETVTLTGYNTTTKNRDASGNWAREVSIRARLAIVSLGLSGGFTVTFDHTPPVNARPELAIVAACLIAAGRDVDTRALYLGEISYNGRVTPTRGVLPILETVEGFSRAFVPRGNGTEAGANTNRIVVQTIANVHDLIDPSNVGFASHTMDLWEPRKASIETRGLPDRVVEALDETASSNKNLLIVGTKAWDAAKLFHELLPRLSASEARSVACMHSIAGLLTDGQIPTVRPFRAPHHTVAEFGLVGRFDRPGEISLAHYGTLVLDHVTQFKRTGLELLKNPVRTNRVTCKRGDVTIEWPAKCRVVATVYPDELRFLSPERVAFLGEYVRVDV